jgi:hypothetical protein
MKIAGHFSVAQTRMVAMLWRVCGFWLSLKTAESKIDSALQFVFLPVTSAIS